MTYCTQCGQPVAPGVQFRTQCSARQTQAVPVLALQPLPPDQTRSGFVLMFLGILARVAVIAIGGLLYAGYVVKDKVAGIAGGLTHRTPDAAKLAADSGQQSAPRDQDGSALLSHLGKLMDGGGEEGDPVESIPSKVPLVPCAPAPFPRQSAARVPLQPGTVITTARVEQQHISFPMLANDERVTLPAIHLAGITASVGKDPRPKKGRPVHTKADLYVIDDAVDPMVLLLRLKDPVDQKLRIEVALYQRFWIVARV